jgi:hypothetical protein
MSYAVIRGGGEGQRRRRKRPKKTEEEEEGSYGPLTRKRTREQRKKGCARTRLMSMEVMAFVACVALDVILSWGEDKGGKWREGRMGE